MSNLTRTQISNKLFEISELISSLKEISKDELSSSEMEKFQSLEDQIQYLTLHLEGEEGYEEI